MKYLVLAMRRPDFRDDVIGDHHRFLAQLREAGRLELTGGFTDASGGAYVLRCDSLEEAREIAFSDPLHTQNCSVLTVFEWKATS